MSKPEREHSSDIAIAQPMPELPPEGTPLTEKEILTLDREVAQTAPNIWFAGEALGHSPTVSEALLHFVRSGGAAKLGDRYPRKHLKPTG